MNAFEPGEVAVLLHNNGGRLFIVHSTDGDGRIVERSSLESQQKYAYGINSVQLVKVASLEAANALVQSLKMAQQRYEQAFYSLQAKRTREFAAAIKPYLDITPPSMPIVCAGCLKPVTFDVVLGTGCECSKRERS